MDLDDDDFFDLDEDFDLELSPFSVLALEEDLECDDFFFPLLLDEDCSRFCCRQKIKNQKR